ncbi:MAG: FlgD immunoglobulin-like domain containing protein [Candidatus Zixiibacteriota bacterium]
MKKIIIILMALLLVSAAFAKEEDAVDNKWTHSVTIGLTYGEGSAPSGDDNMPTPHANVDRTESGGWCSWVQSGMWFATWLSKVTPSYQVSDTFFAGDISYDHQFAYGYYFSAFNSYKTVGRTGPLEVDAGDTLHYRFWFNDGTTDYFWSLDTVFAESPGGGSGEFYITREMQAAADYMGPTVEPCWPPTAVDEPGPNTVNTPREFDLAQNTPNPFNAKTSIEYGIPEDGDVSLDVYDIEGRKITTLVNEYQRAGFYSVAWDGTDDGGSEVSTGSYFYKLKSGDFEAKQRMILLK